MNAKQPNGDQLPAVSDSDAESVESKPHKIEPPNPARWMHERIVRQIVDFEKNLSPEQEVGGQFVQAPGNATIRISGVGFWGPDMIVFHGESQDHQKFQLMQHYSQVSVLLVAVPKEKPEVEARRIGFELLKSVEAEPGE